MKYPLIISSILFVLCNTAEARHRYHAQPTKCVETNIIFPTCGMVQPFSGAATIKVVMHRERAPRAVERVNYREATNTQILPHPAGCPARAFCGCGASIEAFGHSVRNLWLAANWFKFPRAAAASGMAMVRSHHVAILRQHIDGNLWLIADYNSGGHLSRLHVRSIAGYTIVNPHA